jgi:hypothetical protein
VPDVGKRKRARKRKRKRREKKRGKGWYVRGRGCVLPLERRRRTGGGELRYGIYRMGMPVGLFRYY